MPDTFSLHCEPFLLQPNIAEPTMLHTLNCEGMNCPMPIVELTRAARTLQAGDQISVTATDLAFRPDVEAWARRMGHQIESYSVDGELQRALILLGSASP